MVSGKNYQVEFRGRSGMIYSEGQRRLSLHSEMLVDDDYDIVIYLSQALQWEDGTPLTGEDKARIKTNIVLDLQPSRIDWS
jgi:hypothetical protein